MSTTDSPSAIFVKALQDLNLFTSPDDRLDWPVYRNTLPDGPNVKPQAAAVFNTSGILHGKIRGGVLVQHVGVQLRIRVDPKGHAAGYSKASSVESTLAPLSNQRVDMAGAGMGVGNSYSIGSFVQTTPIIDMGQDTEHRHNFTINYIMSITQL